MGYIAEIRWNEFLKHKFRTILWRVVEDKVTKDRICHLFNYPHKKVKFGPKAILHKTKDEALKWAKDYIDANPDTTNWEVVQE
ncbi:hypothetical protein LCGC14_1088500 [marine sediment metagenome]|uniref:Uncharacterized protein n=1 Tax=marine sediment metagenome TaxID=412755 RepID=A0A0F9MHL0_9ZZZZ